MRKIDLKYPIAKHKITHELINAKDALNGKNCECICYSCGENLIAVNKVKKIREHFRHETNSDCSASYESYIHWLTKEVFKKIDFISLPDIRYSVLLQCCQHKFDSIYNEYSVPEVLRGNFTYSILDNINKRIKNLKIKTLEIEKKFITKPGDSIIVDVILKFDNKLLFIEPYVTNPINEIKYSVLKDLNVSTMSIKLENFIASNDHLYTENELIDFIKNDLESKSWVYLKKDALISDKDLEDLKYKIINSISSFDQLNKLTEKEQHINREIYVLNKEIDGLKEKISEIYKEINGKKSLIDDRNKLIDVIQKHIKNIEIV